MQHSPQQTKVCSRLPQSVVASLDAAKPPLKATPSRTSPGLRPSLPPRLGPLPRSSRNTPGDSSSPRGSTSRAAAAATSASQLVARRVARRVNEDGSHLSSLMDKFKTVFKIFFPEKQRPLTPKELGRQRLQMILVADRCGLSPAALIEMKKNTFKALQGNLELEDIEEAEMRFTVTREGGTTYTMAVPVYKAGHELLDPESPQGLGSPAPHLSTDGQAEQEEEEEEGLMEEEEEEEVAGDVGGPEGALQMESKTLEVEVVTDEGAVPSGEPDQGKLMIGEQHMFEHLFEEAYAEGQKQQQGR